MEYCPRDAARLTAPASETEVQLAWGLARRFRIVRRLGAGGMGTVFLAEQLAVGNRPVALKVLNRKLLDDPEFLLRFQDEAASTGRIHHPNVVTIYESGQADDGTPYIAMEYLEGETLSHTLRARGALPVAECAEILQQAARGLNAAHKLGIIHRDLKPDNIFLTYSEDVGAPLVGALAVARADAGRPQEPALNVVKGPPLPVVVKIVDFGIAKLRESATHTLTGTVLGTPAYMSYEQASGMKSDELDARSDIYSLGIVAYEMLTGRLPFQSDTPVGYLRKHLQESPPPFRAVNPNLPAVPQVESVVIMALTKDRNQRYSSVLEFAREFGRVAAADSRPVAQPEPQMTFPAMPKTSVTAGTRETVARKPVAEKWRLWRRRSFLVTGCIVFFLSVLAGGLWYRARLRLRSVRERAGSSAAATAGPFVLERTLTGHQAEVSAVAFTPDGKLLASGSKDKTIKVWDVGSGKLRHTLTGHARSVDCVAFSLDGKMLASGAEDKKIKLWSVDSGTETNTSALGFQSICTGIVPRGWKANSGPPPRVPGCDIEVASVAFSPDGKLLASGNWDDTINLWHLASKKFPQILGEGGGYLVHSLSFSPDGRLLASGSGDTSVKLWDTVSGKLSQTLGEEPKWTLARAVTSVAFSPGGRLLAFGRGDGTIYLWDVGSATVGQTLTGDPYEVNSVAFSPGGKFLASGGGDNMVKVWDVASGALVETLPGHSDIIKSVAFSPDGRLLASGSEDKTIRLWHAVR
jgi:WD40 repeat protein